MSSLPSTRSTLLALATLVATAAAAGAVGAYAASRPSATPATGSQGHAAPGAPSARVIVTTSIYGLTPLSVLYSSVGAYYLRISYDIPCAPDVVILTAQISTSSRNVNLDGDQLGYVEEWSTESGGGPSGQQIACGVGHVTTNDFASADWSGSGPVTFSIDAIVESSNGQSANRTIPLAHATLRFVDTQ